MSQTSTLPTSAGDVPPPPGYTARDLERWVPEPPKSQARTPFQRDRARVLHSSALRRLGAKTQVLGAGSDDFVRTRLTHSLEVAQVGRDIGLELGCDPDIVDAACLSHDLGHPPFGHNGEKGVDAAIKYPWARGQGPDPASPKFGAYTDDLEVYRWARQGAVEGRQCFEAQVMDLADDIAYSVHDVEDAITGRTLDLSRLADPME